jgi:hypothetical protein
MSPPHYRCHTGCTTADNQTLSPKPLVRAAIQGQQSRNQRASANGTPSRRGKVFAREQPRPRLRCPMKRTSCYNLQDHTTHGSDHYRHETDIGKGQANTLLPNISNNQLARSYQVSPKKKNQKSKRFFAFHSNLKESSMVGILLLFGSQTHHRMSSRKSCSESRRIETRKKEKHVPHIPVQFHKKKSRQKRLSSRFPVRRSFRINSNWYGLG